MYSNYSFYPQLYVRGEFVGGYSAVQLMYDFGNLTQAIAEVKEKHVNWTKSAI